MKKILLLSALVLSISASFAQYGKQMKTDSNYDMAVNTVKENTLADAYTDGGYSSDRYFFKVTDKNLQVMKITSYYDCLVKSVKDMSSVSDNVKSMKIAELEAQRRLELNAINAKFFNSSNMASHKVKWTNDVYDRNRGNF